MKILSLAQVDMSQTDARVVHLLDLAKAFRQIGVKTDVVVISPKPSVIKEKNLTVYVLPRWTNFWLIEGIVSSIIAWFILILKCRDTRYDKIYVRHHPNLALALRFLPVRKSIWLEINGFFSAEESYRKSSCMWLRRRAGKWLEKLVFNRASRLFCIDSRLAEKIRHTFSIPDKKTVVVANGVDIELYRPMDKIKCRRQLGLEENVVCIGFIGNFAGWQGVDTLIESLPPILKKHDKTIAVIVGDGEYFNDYIALAEKLNIKNKVLFPGKVHKDIAPEWINTFDIGVALMPPQRICSPLKVFAYMACGIPVLATEASFSQEVKNCTAGILVTYNNRDELIGALEKLSTDEKLRLELGHNGRKCAEKLFSWRIVAERILSFSSK
ncbi:MAG: glycosyltransferase family 4 protein [Planctomycetes bacterium]|nr:glycosyltransferase family 4 protein [Planctomycetota bacterium]